MSFYFGVKHPFFNVLPMQLPDYCRLYVKMFSCSVFQKLLAAERYHPEKITLGHKKETNGLLTSNWISPK